MENFVTLSLETHLFFARIMKEHALFLAVGFPCKNEKWIQRAEWFRQEFEKLLWGIVQISNGRVSHSILKSAELVTCFTIPAEKRTQKLSGIAIDSDLTLAEQKLQGSHNMENNREIFHRVRQINEKSLCLLNDLIDFKENILQEVGEGKLFTTNYPLLIKHILREAKLYRATVEELMRNKCISCQNRKKMEEFWNQIMMEHALFIRGLLDPCEDQLIDTADEFASDYKKLLEMAKRQDCLASGELTKKSLAETLKYREFKTAGTEGILDCSIASIILPLLADHVLREANHFIRILKSDLKD